MAIKQKVIPIFYNANSRVLYFDAIEDFDPKNFKFLKYARGPFAKYATHMINFNDLEDKTKVNRGNVSFRLVQLIRDIENRCKHEELLFGIPFSLQEDMAIKDLEDNELEEFRYVKTRSSND